MAIAATAPTKPPQPYPHSNVPPNSIVHPLSSTAAGRRESEETRNHAQPPQATDPEARLRAAAASGDRAAFASLYATYHSTVFQYLVRRCRGDRHLAEDIAQETFTRALSRLSRYRDTGRPFGAWLVTIAGNLLADYWRSSWNRRHVTWSDFTSDTYDLITEYRQPDPDPADTVATMDGQQRLTRTLSHAISRLSHRQRQVVSLRYAHGLSVADTAHALGLDEGAVKAATYRARRALACDPTVEELR